MSIIDDISPSSTEAEDIRINLQDNGVLHMEMNRPKKFNALNWSMYEAMKTTLNEAKENPQVKAVLWSGKGAMFCSGNDLSMFKQAAEKPQEMAARAKMVLEGFVDAFITFPKPIVAQVQGPAIGIAVTMLGLCDLVYAKENVTFQTPFPQTAQSPEGCSSYLFPAILGPARANAMLLLGEKVTAKQAYDFGLVTQVFGHDFDRQVLTRVNTLVARPPLALQQSKQLIKSHTMEELRKINRKECELLEQLWVADECLNAMVEFATRKR